MFLNKLISTKKAYFKTINPIVLFTFSKNEINNYYKKH